MIVLLRLVAADHTSPRMTDGTGIQLCNTVATGVAGNGSAAGKGKLFRCQKCGAENKLDSTVLRIVVACGACSAIVFVWVALIIAFR